MSGGRRNVHAFRSIGRDHNLRTPLTNDASAGCRFSIGFANARQSFPTVKPVGCKREKLSFFKFYGKSNCNPPPPRWISLHYYALLRVFFYIQLTSTTALVRGRPTTSNDPRRRRVRVIFQWRPSEVLKTLWARNSKSCTGFHLAALLL